MGAAARAASAEAVLEGGIVADPKIALTRALPNAEVKLRRWGLTYFSNNWNRYQVVLDADITRDNAKVRCRMTSPERISDAPTLTELRANDGAEIQRRLTKLVKACAVKQP